MLEFKFDTQLLIEGCTMDEDDVNDHIRTHFAGDCLLVAKTAEPKDGAIAVLVQDGALLVRTVSGKTLLPANPEYPPRALDHTARILGRAVMLVRAL